ncbi:MAG: EamA family transporter [Weeksellaceae bacterium]
MNSKYYLAVIATFVIYGFFSLPLKAIDEFPSLDILLSRLSMASVLILIFSFVSRRKITFENIRIFKSLSKKEKQKLLIVNTVSSAMLAVNWYLFIYVMNRVSVNATALAYMLCPVINTFLAYIFLKDRLSPIQWIAIALSILSCLLLAFGNYSETLYTFSIGLFYAIYLVLQKNNNRLDRFFTLTFQITVGTLILLPLLPYQSSEPEKTVFFFGIVFVIASFFTIIPMYLNVFALNKLSSSTAGIFIYLNPIFSFLLAIFYFKEDMSNLKIISYTIVFFSVILFNSKIILSLLKTKKA